MRGIRRFQGSQRSSRALKAKRERRRGGIVQKALSDSCCSDCSLGDHWISRSWYKVPEVSGGQGGQGQNVRQQGTRGGICSRGARTGSLGADWSWVRIAIGQGVRMDFGC